MAGAAKDDKKAIQLFQMAANQGHPGAQYSVGLCYGQGIGVEKNDEESLKWHTKAAENGYASSQFMVASVNAREQNFSMAVAWLLKAANQGHADAQSYLGLYYSKGVGVQPDLVEAVKWYQLAANQGEKHAMNALGEYMMSGKGGLKQDIPAAAQLFLKAAKQGLLNAQFNIAQCYHFGAGISQSDNDALLWYLEAAKQGDQEARERAAQLLSPN